MSISISEERIAQAVVDYANRHAVDVDAVDVTRSYSDDGNEVHGYRLSLDKDDRSRGCDEYHGFIRVSDV